MCGIVTIADSKRAVQPAQIDAMRGAITHRGPDAAGTVVRHTSRVSVGLGSQRLSILDLSEAGTMPMPNAQETAWIAYNGELYNHLDLRGELERKGYRYRSHTDTETVLHAYEAFDTDCFARFNGMFACAIFDHRQSRVVIARDRTGVKPLYFHASDGRMVCASELKAMTTTGLVPAIIDPQALDVYLALGYVPAPYSLIAGVRKLEAGTFGVFEDGRLTIERYWSPVLDAGGTRPRPWADVVEHTRAAVDGAIRRQMMSDVPVGVMLSGGLDSTIVAAVAQQASNEALHTFSIGFETQQSSLEPAYNADRTYAQRVAESLGTRHHEIVITDELDLLDNLRHLVAQLDEPVWEPTFLSIYLISSLAREHGVKVLLSGDGSDELFGGYPWYPALRRLEQIERVPGLRPVIGLFADIPLPGSTRLKFRDLHTKYRHTDTAKYRAQYSVFGAEARAALLNRTLANDPLDAMIGPLFERQGNASLAARFARLEMHLWVGEHFNQRLDRMTMAASVEGRVPFQDNAVVELALGLSDAEKLQDGRGKAPLRAAFEGKIPDFVLNRPKRPFAAPATSWMNGALRPAILQALSPVSLGRLPGVTAQSVATLQRSFERGMPVRQEQVWTLFHLMLWLDGLVEPSMAVAI
jgi:asparagine synthase (glutamine-hydrolysing)